jgi:hypothetical protein
MKQHARRLVASLCAVLLLIAGHAALPAVTQDESVSAFVTLPLSALTSEKWSTEFKSLAPESKNEAISQVQSKRKTDRREALVHLIGLLSRELARSELTRLLTVECVFHADERVIEALVKVGAVPDEDCFQIICFNKDGGYRALITLSKQLDLTYAITSPSSSLVQYAALRHNIDVLKLMIQLGGDPFRRCDLYISGGCLGSVLKGVNAAEAAAYLEHAEVDYADEVLEFLIQNYSNDPRFPTRQKLLSIAKDRKKVIADEGWRTRDTYEYFLKWLSNVEFKSPNGSK